MTIKRAINTCKAVIDADYQYATNRPFEEISNMLELAFQLDMKTNPELKLEIWNDRKTWVRMLYGDDDGLEAKDLAENWPHLDAVLSEVTS